MKIPVNWLKEYVDIDISSGELAHRLTMAGLEVVGTEKIAGDTVFEVEVTPNRPDWLSIYGVAREVAAITGKKLKTLDLQIPTAALKDKKADIKIIDKKGCPRYTGRVIDGVKIEPSPRWLAQKIEAVGLRPVNNVVDITNFVLFELGQPLHAFDYDKLNGAKIIVRRAQKGEELTTIDGEKRTLDEKRLVIADELGPVALAGVMGGLNTEVSNSTKTILLESAYFDPPLIRATARDLGLASESSYRFERKVDLEGVSFASKRAAELICSICGGKAQESLKDAGIKKIEKKPITLDIKGTNALLGVKIKEAQMQKILKALGFSVSAKRNKILAKPPSYRNDIKKDVDIIEEIARVWGYENIPTRLPNVIPSYSYTPKSKTKIVEDIAKDTLISLGLDEIVTYSLIGSAHLKNAKIDQEDAIALLNPLSSEQEFLRTSLIPTVLGCVAWNLNRKNMDLNFFEIGSTYHRKKEQPPSESKRLCIAITGKRHDDWLRKDAPVTFYDLKGIAEELFHRIGINKYKFIPSDNPVFSHSASAKILIDGHPCGISGLIGRQVLDVFELSQKVFVLELDFDKAVEAAVLETKFSALPKYPSSYRDISILADEEVSADQIISVIREESAVKSIKVFDQYKGKNIPQGKKSLAFSIEYQRRDRTLTDEEVNSAHSNITQTLQQKLSVQLR